jgi:hypothetical protein
LYITGEKKMISIREMSFDEYSSDGLVLYQLAGAPEFGELQYKDMLLLVGDGFTQPDILAEHIRYKL